MAKLVPPPFKPRIAGDDDVSNFDPAFTRETFRDVYEPEAGTPLSPSVQRRFSGFSFSGERREESS